jgi:spermidine synthase
MTRTSSLKTPTGSLALLGGLFALSGATALVYEVVWFRLIFLRLGGTGLSVATVTAAFMAGLGLGAWLFGDRLAQRMKPVRLYALLEAFIGLYALLVPSLVTLAGNLDTLMLGADAAGPGARLVRYLLVGIVLLPATMCMGGTLPVLARLVQREGLRPGRFVGTLYGLNTTGAVLGAISGGFFLLPSLGFASTVHACAAANLTLAVAALLLARSFAGATAGTTTPVTNQPASGKNAGDSGRGVVAPRPVLALVAYTTSGLVAFMLQVSWTRILSVNFASSLYAFSLILGIFLTGLGVGALLAAPVLDRTTSPARALAWTFSLAGATALLGQSLYQYLPGFYLDGLLAHGAGLALGSAAALAMVIMLPTTLALGVGFPLAVRLATGDRGSDTASHVGRLYAANTSGAVVGAFATALFLIPALGLAGVVSLAGCLALALGILLALISGSGKRGPAWGALALAVGSTVAWGTVVPEWNRNLMSQSVAFWWDAATEQQDGLRQSLEEMRLGGGPRLLFYRDGVTATVAVKEEGPVDGPNNRFLAIDGKIDASSTGDMRTQVFLGQLPLLLAKQPARDVLIIGLASGVTTGSVLTHPVEHAVVLEIEGAVHQAATFFNDFNGRPLDDARTQVVVEDARAYIERSDRKFDAIISEPSSAWLSGSARLFTREAFTAYRQRLNPGGILCQWLQTYDLSQEELAGVVRTLQDVFPHVAVFHGDLWDLLLLASNEPLALQPGTLAQRMALQPVARDLARARAATPCHLLDALVAEPAAVAAAVGSGPINTDDNAWIELTGPQVRGTSARDAFIASLRGPSLGAAALLQGLAPDGDIDAGPLADQCLREGALHAAGSLARHGLQQEFTSQNAWVLGESLRGLDRRQEALEVIDRALAEQPDEPRTLITRALILKELGSYDESVETWSRAEEAMGRPDVIVLSGRGRARLLAGDFSGALDDLTRTREMGAGRTPAPQLIVDLARALAGSGRATEARLELEAFTAGLSPEPTADLAAIAARQILADLRTAQGSGGERVARLQEQAAAGRLLAVRSLLVKARWRLQKDGLESASAYLQDLAARDPGMAEALNRSLAIKPAEGDWAEELIAAVRQLAGD